MFKRTPTTRVLFFLFFDVIIISLAVFMAFLLRFDGLIPAEYFGNYVIWKIIILAIIFCVPLFWFFKLYSFSWSYVSAQELIALFEAVTLGFLILAFAIFFSRDFPFFTGIPRSVLFISYFFVFVLSGGFRLSKRIYFIIFKKYNNNRKEKTLIVGAGDAGEQILRSIMTSPDSPYLPVGFADDNSLKQGVSIHGIKVFGKIIDIPKIVTQKEIKQIIVALPSAGSKKIREAVDLSKQSGVHKIRITPPISEIITGDVSFKNLKEVDVSDLLGRDEVFLDTKKIGALLKQKRVLITGSAGSIGSELSRQVAKFNPSLILLLDQDETGIFNIGNELKKNFDIKIEQIIADITNKEKIQEVFNKFKPEIVFHAAAYKHVPLMEENSDEAIKNNIFGTEILAKTSLENNVEKFIFISTDKAVNPTSVMGATKRISEMICQVFNQKKHTKFISVRFGNVLNSRGSVIPIFKEQIRLGGPVEVTDPEMKRYFMLISEACLLVLQASSMGEGGEVFVLDMGKPVKILDLAKEMIRLSGFEPDKDIAIIFTGVRPGEKLFEEILTAEEGTVATQNKKIFKAKLSDIDPVDLEQKLDKLKTAKKENLKNELMLLCKN